MSIYLGIDPGKKGAIALFDVEACTVKTHDMPGTTRELHDLIASLPIIKRCTVEKPFYPQMIGVTNAAKIAQAYGTLIGALAWRDIPFAEVPPNKWKLKLSLSNNKNASREMAMQRFPDDADQFKRVKDDGRAEAALLAIYGAGLA